MPTSNCSRCPKQRLSSRYRWLPFLAPPYTLGYRWINPSLCTDLFPILSFFPFSTRSQLRIFFSVFSLHFQDQAGGRQKQFCVWVILITTNRVRPVQSKSEGATWVGAPPNFYITLSSGKRQVAHFENSSDSPCQTDYLSVFILLHMSYSIFDDWMTEKKIMSVWKVKKSRPYLTTRSPQYAFENIMGRFLRF